MTNANDMYQWALKHLALDHVSTRYEHCAVLAGDVRPGTSSFRMPTAWLYSTCSPRSTALHSSDWPSIAPPASLRHIHRRFHFKLGSMALSTLEDLPLTEPSIISLTGIAQNGKSRMAYVDEQDDAPQVEAVGACAALHVVHGDGPESQAKLLSHGRGQRQIDLPV